MENIICLPVFDDNQTIEQHELECLKEIFRVTDILPYQMKQKIGIATDYSGPAAYQTAIVNYICNNTPFEVVTQYLEYYN